MSKLSKSKPFYRGSYFLVRCIAALLSLGPLSWARAKGAVLGLLYRRIDRKHYRRSIEHLQQAFPEKSIDEIRTIARDNYTSIGTSLIELFSLDKIYTRYHNNPQFINKKIMDDALAEGNGVIVVTGHIGNWELTGLLSALSGMPFNAIARPIDNPFINTWIEKLRQSFGGTIISKWGAVKGSLRALKKGEVVTILIDQDGGKDGIMVPFFNRDASTIPLAPLLAQRTGAPILLAYGKRGADGSYTVIVEKRIEIAQGDSRKEVLAKTTALCTAELEKVIRKDPSCWLWMHRRWKTQRNDEAPLSEAAHTTT